jgi:hypothetical protein
VDGLAVARLLLRKVVKSVPCWCGIEEKPFRWSPFCHWDSLHAAADRVCREDAAYALLVLKPSNPFGHSWQEIRIDRFSDHLSEEGPRMEIASAVGWHQEY